MCCLSPFSFSRLRYFSYLCARILYIHYELWIMNYEFKLNNMKKVNWIVCIAIAFAGVLASSCGKAERKQTVADFKTTKVEKKDMVIDRKYSATIRGCQDVEVYPQVGGTLQKIYVTEGERVRRGQVLFLINPVPFQAALNRAQAALKAAKAAEATAELNYESKKTLREQNVISEFDLKTAYNSLMNAKAQVAQAEAQVMDAAEDVEHTRVESPADGVVGNLPYRQGSLVGSAIPQPLTTISDNSSMWVYFSMSESEFLKMTRSSGSPEKAIEAMPAVRLQLVDGSEYDHLGKVEAVSGVIDRNTGSVQLRAVFENPEGLLHSGSTGNVVIPVEYKNALVVPASATVQIQDRFRLYTIAEDGTAKGINVSIDPLSSGREFIVTDGVEAGTEIIAEGAGMVREGQKVK